MLSAARRSLWLAQVRPQRIPGFAMHTLTSFWFAEHVCTVHSYPQAAGASQAPAAAAAAASRRLWSSDVGQPHDKILLRGLVFHGYHGVLPEVRAL